MHWNGSSTNNISTANPEQLPCLTPVLLDLLEHVRLSDPATDSYATLYNDPVLLYRLLLHGAADGAVPLTCLERGEYLAALLGQEHLHTVLMTSAVNSYFSKTDAQLQQALRKYWGDALGCAFISHEVARALNYPNPGEAYCAGLLHNLGQLMLLIGNPKDYTETYLESDCDQGQFLFEQEWFGVNSNTLSARALEGLVADSFLADALLYQHEATTAVADAPLLVQILNSAVKLSANNGDLADLARTLQPLLGLDQAQLEELMRTARQRQARLYHQLQLPQHSNSTPPLSDASNKQRLANQIKDFATLYSTCLATEPAESKPAFWQGLLKNLNILLGGRCGIAFEYQPDDNRLTAQATHGRHLAHLRQLRLRVDQHHSLVARALHQGAPVFSESATGSEPRSLTDQQLLRFLEVEALACIPLSYQGAKLGVLVLGVPSAQLQEVKRQDQLIDLFAKTASRRLALLETGRRTLQQTLENQQEQQSNQVRELALEAANPLGAISNYVEALAQSGGNGDKSRSQLQRIQAEIQRIAELLSRLEAVDKCVHLDGTLTNINRLINDQVDRIRRSWFAQRGIFFEVERDPAIPPIKLPMAELEQALAIILQQAAMAIPNGGCISINSRAGVRFNGEPHIQLTINSAEVEQPMVGQTDQPSVDIAANTAAEDSTITLHRLVASLNGQISSIDGNPNGAEFTLLLPC